MSHIIKFVVFLVLALPAILGIQQHNKLEYENNQLIANTTQVEISQDTNIKLTQITESTPIPTTTPSATSTPTPQKIAKVTITPTQLPKSGVMITPKPAGYDFKWEPRTALDYTQTDKEYVKQRICAYFTTNCNEALIIASHESGYRTNAASSGYFSTTNMGVFQINCKWQKNRVSGDCLKYFDLETNLRIAKQIYSEQGWSPWSTKVYL